MNSVAKITPVVATQIISKSIDLVNSILKYRAGCLQLEVARESMHRQADFAENQLKAEFLSQMTKLKSLANAYNLTMAQLGQTHLNRMKTLENLEINEQNLWKVYFADNLPQEHKGEVLELIKMLSQQRMFFLKEHELSDNEATLKAFSMFADSIDLGNKLGKRTFNA